MEYETVIGLEVHAQVKTESKIFCSCSTKFGQAPNESTCPICLGMPGVLPVLNEKVLRFAMRACLATHCSILPLNRFARKNYFYPDLPKGYQISQFELPLGEGGHVNIEVDGVHKRIGLTRIHMEEDAGKLIHGENLGNPGNSYVDFNRTGVPLMEIVSEPELRSPDEAKAYLMELKSILEYTEVSDCNMEEGSFRCDANISLRPVGQKEFGTRAELKNMNSFKFIQKALNYEIMRQSQILDQGEKVIQESRLYDPDKGVTYSMRSKEEAHDYRYFPDPDLVPIVVEEKWIEDERKYIPELPEQKRDRFTEEFKIPAYDARVLTADRKLANYFEDCVKLHDEPKIISNWIMGDLLRELNNDGREIAECPVEPKALTDLLKFLQKGTISGKIAKTVFEEMYKTGKSSASIIEEKGHSQISDESTIIKLVEETIAANPEQCEQYRSGKDKVIGFLVGKVMQATKGQANPAMVNKLLKEKIGKS